MNHTCNELESDGKCPDMFTCGDCGEHFNTICSLHVHVTIHNAEGSYHYDSIIKVAFPKYDSTCMSTQTDEMLTSYILQTEFAKKLRNFTNVKHDPVDELDETVVEVKDEGDNVRSHIVNKDATSLSKPMRKDQLIEKEENDFISVAVSDKERKFGSPDVILIGEMCPVRIQEKYDGMANSLHGEQQVIKCKSNFRHRRSNLASVRKAAKTTEITAKHLSDAKPGRNKSLFDSNVRDGDSDKSDLNRCLTENMQEKASEFCENVQNYNHGFKVPKTEQFYKKKIENITMPVSETDLRTGISVTDIRFRKSLKEIKKEKQQLASWDRVRENEDFTTENQRGQLDTEDEKYVKEMDNDKKIDKDEYMDTVDSGLQTSKDKKYFCGKIVSQGYIIERLKSTGIFCKGEKNEDNQVFVDDTWLPVSELINDGIVQYNCDKTKNSDIQVVYGIDTNADIDKLSQKEDKSLRNNWKYKQELQLVCNQCCKSFKHKHHYEGHMNSHANHKPYICQYCGKPYPNKATLQTHEQHVHSDMRTWFKCSICNEKSFPTAPRLRIHERTHLTDYKHICNTCNKSYKSLNLLKAHIEYSHKSKKFRCRNCKKSFDSNDERDLHQKVKHGTEFKCSTCGRHFTSAKSKHRHEKIHKGLKPHECHICLRRFLQKTPFWVHMEKHHDLTKADLILLFPEKHSNRNHQHLTEKKKLAEHLETNINETVEGGINDIELITDNSEEIREEI